MLLGASQHHVAVTTRLSVVCRGCSWSGRDGSRHAYLLFKREQSSVTKSKQYAVARSLTANQPEDCFDDKTEFPAPSLSKRAVPRNVNHTVDLDKTRPAPLQSPPDLDPKAYPNGKPPIGDRARHLFKIGKSYLAFYKTGFKNVWYNNKQTRAIQQNIAPHSLDTAAKYGGQVRSGSQIPTISHAEYQFCVRSRHDIFKLIPFSLVFAICGEFTPLVIIALGTVVVPYTCRIPQQEWKDLQAKLRKNEKYTEIMARSLQATDTADSPNALLQTTSQSEGISWEQEWLEAYRYGLTSLRQPIPVLGYLYHHYILQPRLIKHCNTLLCNTILIHREGGFSNLDARSIFEWAEKYSLSALDRYLNKQIAQQKQKTNSKSIKLSISEICSTPDFRRVLGPACEKESAYILNQDWTRLKPACHWRAVFRSIANNHDQSPDTRNRRNETRNWSENQVAKPDAVPAAGTQPRNPQQLTTTPPSKK